MESKEGTWQRNWAQEEEARGSRQKSVPSQARNQKPQQDRSWLQRHCSSLLRRDKQAQKAGQLFSGLMAMNVVFLGSAFICSMIFNQVAITVDDVWIFLTILKLMALVWIIYYLLFTRRKPHAILHQDSHAGPIWIKGSLVLFGGCSVLLNMFQIGYAIIHIHCKSQVALLSPSVEILFICIQTYFICRHAKDCTHIQQNLTRCGLMLTLATNLLLWLLAVTNDSVHREIESELNHTEQGSEGKVPPSSSPKLCGQIASKMVNMYKIEAMHISTRKNKISHTTKY